MSALPTDRDVTMQTAAIRSCLREHPDHSPETAALLQGVELAVFANRDEITAFALLQRAWPNAVAELDKALKAALEAEAEWQHVKDTLAHYTSLTEHELAACATECHHCGAAWLPIACYFPLNGASDESFCPKCGHDMRVLVGGTWMTPEEADALQVVAEHETSPHECVSASGEVA